MNAQVLAIRTFQRPIQSMPVVALPQAEDSDTDSETLIRAAMSEQRRSIPNAQQTPEFLTDRFIADNYDMYMPSLSGSVGKMTLGGDTLFMTDASVSKYSEDIADRNMTKTTRQLKPVGEPNTDNTVRLNDNEDADRTVEWAPGMSTAF